MIRTHVAINVGVDHDESVEAAELIILALAAGNSQLVGQVLKGDEDGATVKIAVLLGASLV